MQGFSLIRQMAPLLVVVFLGIWTAADAQSDMCEYRVGIYDGLITDLYDYEARYGHICNKSQTTQHLVWQCTPRFCDNGQQCTCDSSEIILHKRWMENTTSMYCWELIAKLVEQIIVCCPGYLLNVTTRTCYEPCNKTACQYCKNDENFNAVCYCPDGQTLNADGITCSGPPVVVEEPTPAPVVQSTPAPSGFPAQYIAAAVVGGVVLLALLLLPLLLWLCCRRRRPPVAVSPTDAFANKLYSNDGLPAYYAEIEKGKKGKKEPEGVTVVAGDRKAAVSEYETITGDEKFSQGEGLAAKAQLARQRMAEAQAEAKAKAEAKKRSMEGVYEEPDGPKNVPATGDNEYAEIIDPDHAKQ